MRRLAISPGHPPPAAISLKDTQKKKGELRGRNKETYKMAPLNEWKFYNKL